MHCETVEQTAKEPPVADIANGGDLSLDAILSMAPQVSPVTKLAPTSSTDNTINLCGLIAFAFAICVCNGYRLIGFLAVVISVLSYGGTILLFEAIFLRTPWRESVGLDFSRRNISPKRIVVKLIGIYGSFGFIGFLYWLFPEYRGTNYKSYFEALNTLLPVVFLLAIPYTAFMDGYLKFPQDTYYRFGQFLLCDWESLNQNQISQHLLGWLVKGFFLPLMYTALNGKLIFLASQELLAMPGNFEEFFRRSLSVLYTVDLLVAVTGYVLTVRLFDTHVRSTEPTMFGWWICTMCYQPFQAGFLRLYITNYGNDENWMVWLRDYPILQAMWGILALASIGLYIVASINFGCRFSNLTHRGVLTNGMYRFCKHPAYVSKNLHWWLIFVPFLPKQDIYETIRCCLLLAGTNLIYFLRARTEEKHLSNDPKYVAYALWMNDHSIFRGLCQIIPGLRYTPPFGWQDRDSSYDGLK